MGSPSLFYIQSLETYLARKYDISKEISQPIYPREFISVRTGVRCLVTFKNSKGCIEYFRGRVAEADRYMDMVPVLFVDYGVTERMERRNVRKFYITSLPTDIST